MPAILTISEYTSSTSNDNMLTHPEMVLLVDVPTIPASVTLFNLSDADNCPLAVILEKVEL